MIRWRNQSNPDIAAWFSLDYFVRSRQHIRGYGESDLLGGFQIDEEFELRRLLHWKIGGLSALQNLAHTFTYRDRKNEDRRKLMTLGAEEFIRRFLLHVIPKGFMRVRHYGFLANQRKDCLSKCRQLMGLSPALIPLPQRSPDELMLALMGIDIHRCPRCQTGTLMWVSDLTVSRTWDSSCRSLDQIKTRVLLLLMPEPKQRCIPFRHFLCY